MQNTTAKYSAVRSGPVRSGGVYSAIVLPNKETCRMVAILHHHATHHDDRRHHGPPEGLGGIAAVQSA